MNGLPPFPNNKELGITAEEAEQVARAIDFVYQSGGSIQFYTCSGVDATAFRFYIHCREDKFGEWVTNNQGYPLRAILRLYKAVVGRTYDERIQGGRVADDGGPS